MSISDQKLSIIQRILSLHSEVDSLDKYLYCFSQEIARLIECEYHAISLIPNQLLNRDFQFLSNNPSGFNEVYMEHFIKRDELLVKLFNNPHQIHSYKSQNNENEILKSLHRDVREIRAAEDFCYTPIKCNKSIIGFMGHAKGNKDYRIIGEKEFQLINMLLPSLQSGLELFSLKERLNVQSYHERNGDIIGSVLIAPTGDLEILKGDSLDLFKEILGIPDISLCTSFGLGSLIDGSPSLTYENKIQSNKRIITHNGEKYHLTIISSQPQIERNSLGMKMITIEKAKPTYNTDLYALTFGLSKREHHIVNLITQGFSNKKISEYLYIAESTVKKHISNIYEKTSVCSRLELLSSLNQ